jgi:outer membrane protein assembly factor BamA
MDTLNSYLPYNQDNSVSSGMLFPILYDSRRNSANPKQGFMAGLTFRFNTPWLGSDEKWQSMFLDVRKYFPLTNRKSDVVAIRGYYWTTLSGEAPYLDLPSVRWEPTGRAIITGHSAKPV